MKLTLKIKLLTSEKQGLDLLKTIKECNRFCNEISQKAWTEKIFNQFRLHRAVYHGAKKTSHLAAQMLVRCIGKVAGSYRLDKRTQRRFRTLGAIIYDCRILSYKGKTVSIWSINGRLRIPFVCHNPKYLPYIKGEADLVYKKGKFYLFQTVEIPEEDIKDVEAFIGVDFGIINLAMTSDGKSFSGLQVDKVRQRMTKIKKALQKKGSKSAKRHLKKLSGRERQFKKITNHSISKTIVQTAKDTRRGIALEKLKGFRVSVRKEQREQFGKWTFAELAAFIGYKAQLAGIPVVFVNPRNTSCQCSACGHVAKSNRRSQSLFLCQHCGFSIHADLNAALNIALRASVNGPIVAGAPSGKRSVSNRVTSRLL